MSRSLNPIVCRSCLVSLRILGVEQPYNQVLHVKIELTRRPLLVHDDLFAFLVTMCCRSILRFSVPGLETPGSETMGWAGLCGTAANADGAAEPSADDNRKRSFCNALAGAS